MQNDKNARALRRRIESGEVSRADVVRRLAELAFGEANDCVRLALEESPALEQLDLSLLSEIRRNEKGTVEIKLIDRLKALEQLTQAAGRDNSRAEQLLLSLREAEGSP